jgi:hypothetical protein
MPAAEPLRVTLGGAVFARFCLRWIRQTKGRWAGAPLTLEPWQVGLFSELLRTEPTNTLTLRGAKARDPLPHVEGWLDDLSAQPGRVRPGRRVYQEAYVQLAKKNGKSSSAAALALYFLVADGEEGAEVYSAAKDRQQARIVFEQA